MKNLYLIIFVFCLTCNNESENVNSEKDKLELIIKTDKCEIYRTHYRFTAIYFSNCHISVK